MTFYETIKNGELRVREGESVRELLCNAIARNKTWDENVVATGKVQRTFEETLMTKRVRKMAKGSIEIARGPWDHYDRWRRLDLY